MSRSTVKAGGVTYSKRTLKSGKVAFYRGGKRLSQRYGKRVVDGLLRQQAQGITPSIRSARGHRFDATARKARRAAFRAALRPYFLTRSEINADASLNEGSYAKVDKIGRTRWLKSSWAATWWSADLKAKYDWYAKIRVLNAEDETSSYAGLPVEFVEEQDGTVKETIVITLLLQNDAKGPYTHGYQMDDMISDQPDQAIDGDAGDEVFEFLEQIVDDTLEQHGLVRASQEEGPFTDDLLGLFRHRDSNAERRQRR